MSGDSLRPAGNSTSTLVTPAFKSFFLSVSDSSRPPSASTSPVSGSHVEGQDVAALALAGRGGLRLVAQVERRVAREHLHLADSGPTERVELLERQLVAHLAERLALLVLGGGHVDREQRPQHFALLGPALEP